MGQFLGRDHFGAPEFKSWRAKDGKRKEERGEGAAPR